MIRLHRYFQIIKREIGFFEAISLLYKNVSRHCIDAISKGDRDRSTPRCLRNFQLLAYQCDAEWRFSQVKISPRGMRLIRFTFNEGRLCVKKDRRFLCYR